ncbi:16S rRNA processing protein RimM [Mesoplasma syrphidae]|uniref:Ribosome maturation factor RimM n=1 Tax=Mesoplasma syrphidae TaxID=225999 RepID=A0A2K9C9F0_9MOLU|nr:hypothetical protein [Mesoplasma syrphidae]AUF83655.1 16S rRNA processing protein RimM [Mesoplasma syrphidae]
MNLEKDLLSIGTIVNTFGTKGFVKVVLNKEIEVINELSTIKLLFVKNISKSLQPLQIEKVEFKNEILLLKFVDLNEINHVIKFKGLQIYSLTSDRVFKYKPMMTSYKVIYNEEIGKILEAFNNGAHDVIKISLNSQKAFWVPLVDVYFKKIDHEKQVIVLKNLEELK